MAAAFYLMLPLCGGAWAEEAGRWSIEVGPVAYRLDEFSASGDRTVHEDGTLLQAAVTYRRAISPAAQWWVQGQWQSGRVGYDGRTQAGTPAQSNTKIEVLQVEWGLRHAVALLGPAWSAGLGVRAEHFRRDIQSTSFARGLDERLDTQSLFVELRRDALWGAGDAQSQGRARGAYAALRLGAGPSGRMAVDFKGLFDPAAFESGSTRWASLAIGASPWGPRAPRIEVAASQWRISRSDPSAVARQGVAVGTVTQPAFKRLMFGVNVGLAF